MDAETQTEWQAPPPPEQLVEETAQMSEIATIGNIFFEPERTFEDLRRKPRFVIASLIIALLATAYGFGLYYKVGDEGMRRFLNDQMERNVQTQGLSTEQKQNAVSLNLTITSVVRYAMPVFVLISIVIGGLLYWGAGKAFGGDGSFLGGLSVWVYSSIPPVVVSMAANLIVLMFKSVDEIDIAASQRGVIHANPSFFMDGKASPVMATLVGTFDLFFIWGWILAAIGLRVGNKISSGSAWAIVIIFALVGLVFRMIGAMFGGTAN